MRKKTLLIVGGAPQREGNRRLPPYRDELWTFLSVANANPDLGHKATQIWDCHDLPIATHEGKGVIRDRRWHKPDGSVTFVRDVRRERHLVAEILDQFGRRMASQAHWMVATALLHQDYGHIILWRMYYEDSPEAAQQVPDMMYLIGYGEAQGVTFQVDPLSMILKPRLYGFEET